MQQHLQAQRIMKPNTSRRVNGCNQKLQLQRRAPSRPHQPAWNGITYRETDRTHLALQEHGNTGNSCAPTGQRARGTRRAPSAEPHTAAVGKCWEAGKEHASYTLPCGEIEKPPQAIIGSAAPIPLPSPDASAAHGVCQTLGAHRGIAHSAPCCAPLRNGFCCI